MLKALCIFWSLLVAQSFAQQSYAMNSSSQKPSVVGTWRLLKMERLEPTGQWAPRCHSPSGLLTYTAQGYMAVGINCMKAENSKEPTADPQDMIFYTGRYELNESELVHHIMNSAGLDFFGRDLKRNYQFEGDRKFLVTGPGKNGRTVRMLWERLP